MKLKYFHDATYLKKSLPFQTRYFHNCDFVNALNFKWPTSGNVSQI